MLSWDLHLEVWRLVLALVPLLDPDELHRDNATSLVWLPYKDLPEHQCRQRML